MLSLFENAGIDPTKNLLPYDGEVNYYGIIFDQEKADSSFTWLMKKIEWKPDEALILGKKIYTKRKVAWYADRPLEYMYSKITKQSKIWIPELLKLKKRIEKVTGENYNSCLLNLYHDGSEGMAWHSDGEPDLKENGAIASLTLGAERKFVFKHKTTKERVELYLPHGSLLVMKGTTQKYWLHRLPP